MRRLLAKPHAAASALATQGPQRWNMAKAIAEILTLGDEKMLATDSAEVEYSLDLLKVLRKRHADATIKPVMKHRDQLGHPSKARLMTTLVPPLRSLAVPGSKPVRLA